MKRSNGPIFNFDGIDDDVIRRNFQNLQAYFDSLQIAVERLAFMELVFTAATAHQKVSHSFGAIPLDVILTHLSGTGSVTFNHGLFDASNLDISVSGPCRVRFMYGIQGLSSTVNSPSTDTQTFNPGG